MEKQKNFEEVTAALAAWDDRDVAFIKADVQNGRDMWMICAADGTKLASTDNRDYAFVVAKQNNLTPKSVH